MPISNGAACEFTEAEVAWELARMGSGKALDLKGLSIEMLRWGGPKCLQRSAHNIDMQDLHQLFSLPSAQLGWYILSVDQERTSAMVTTNQEQPLE
ncbi:hypothetical protein R1sor_014126 [Riccia sorocarpa]|uniref:Uncharacterized protein n=1 Tax=Riccia sorocarpa TaxID=122646 RepID=A0ABD3HB49_9MARC